MAVPAAMAGVGAKLEEIVTLNREQAMRDAMQLGILRRISADAASCAFLKESAKRFDAARELAKKLDCTIGDIFLTIGPYDLVVMFEAPDDETAARFNLILAAGGNVRTTTMKALPEDSYRKIVGEL